MGGPVGGSVDVVVVGAGLAGLTAARELSTAGLRVQVLEARDRVGGRTLNHDLGHGEVVETGGQFVGPTQHHVRRLAADLGVPLFPAHDDGDSVYVRGHRARRFAGDVPPDHLALPDVAMTMLRMNAASRAVPVEAPWEAPRAAELDAITLETWIRRTTIGSGGLELVNVLLGSAFGATAAEVSALFALWYVAGAGDAEQPGTLERMIGVAGGAQESRLVGGSQRLSLLLADELGDRVALGRPVRSIRQDRDGVSVVTDAGTWRAARVVVAVPPPLAARIAFDPVLPAQQHALFERMSFGSLMKCEAVYETPFWREQGLSGQGVFRGDAAPVCSMFDNSPPSGTPGVLMGFVGGAEWRRWSVRPGRERRGAVLRSFARVVGPQALRPLDYLEQDWTDEEWTRGGPTSVLTPGVLTGIGRWRDVAFDRVHWAGAEHAHYWNGFMDGAISSATTTAAAVLEEI
ncbi:flavin monoamine oxidase family protein [Nocardioides plantarum]|uniref:Flavin monoamine oxidase family protein n=1 Tax=Nocardioides plantarum TaxID=29299 RepID=A0ABV5KJG9_9ACTN|nr:NAD(P)/FAD-dependent oxidoreductase [Nocardioides plantarum]